MTSLNIPAFPPEYFDAQLTQIQTDVQNLRGATSMAMIDLYLFERIETAQQRLEDIHREWCVLSSQLKELKEIFTAAKEAWRKSNENS